MSQLPVPTATPIRAAEYCRMSTDHQDYSIANQQDANRQFAAAHGMVIVQSYIDDGKSGVTVKGRTELIRLLTDVRSRSLDTEVILVLDVSRWGRFQDPDEAAYHEFSCKKAGYPVIYTAEPFVNDRGPLASVVKFLKRAWAGEFSRELAVKMFRAQARLARRGHWCGGDAGYGHRRAVVSDDGTVRILERGQWKSKTDRSVIVLGPCRERETIKRIFTMYVYEERTPHQIADLLNLNGVPGVQGRPWRGGGIHSLLQQERLVGCLVWGRKASSLLHGTKPPKPLPEEWIRVPGALPQIIDDDLFARAQIRMAQQREPVPDDVLLEELRQLLQKEGKLSGPLIQNSRGTRSLPTYLARFKNMSRIYSLLDCPPARRGARQNHEELARKFRRQISDEIQSRLSALGSDISVNAKATRLTVNEVVTLSISALTPRRVIHQDLWWFYRHKGSHPDLRIIARLNVERDRIIDFHLIPARIFGDRPGMILGQKKGGPLDACRHETLDALPALLGLLQADEVDEHPQESSFAAELRRWQAWSRFQRAKRRTERRVEREVAALRKLITKSQPVRLGQGTDEVGPIPVYRLKYRKFVGHEVVPPGDQAGFC